jgi:hypothetical protein
VSERADISVGDLVEVVAALVEMLDEYKDITIQASRFEKPRPTVWYARKYVRRCLLRVQELSRSCLKELQDQHFAVAALLSRSVIETSAMLLLFSKNLGKLAVKPDIERIRSVVFSHYLGTKAFEILGAAKAPHVMDAIRSTKQLHPWVESAYDMLSDVAHPNWAGTTQLFLDDLDLWRSDPRINREFARNLTMNILLGLYSIQLAQDAAVEVDRLLNELSVSQETRGV